MSTNLFEPKHTLFDSLEEMLAPETLSELLSEPVTSVDCQPINGHSGLAGGQLSYVDTNAGRFVLKRMSIASDWIMFASNDHLCCFIEYEDQCEEFPITGRWIFKDEFQLLLRLSGFERWQYFSTPEGDPLEIRLEETQSYWIAHKA